MSESETPASKAAARQAKILAKSADRLAKITGSAKGEGRIASDTSVGISSSPKPSVVINPAPPTSLSVDDDPEDIDLALTSPAPLPRVTRSQSTQQHQKQQLAQMEAMGLGGAGSIDGAGGLFGGMNGMGGMGGPGGDIFAQMMASMNGSAAGSGGATGGISTPGGGYTTIPLNNFPPAPKTMIDRLFPSIHFFSMVALAVYAIFWLEPARKFGLYGWMGVGETVDWRNWAELSGRAPARNVVTKMVGSGLAEVPLFWMFITVEMLLQTTRLFLVRNRPPPPGIITTILPFLQQFSPQSAFLLTTMMKYFHLLSIGLNDLAVLIFCIGLAVVYGQFIVGNQTGGMIGILEDAAEVVLDTIKDEL